MIHITSEKDLEHYIRKILKTNFGDKNLIVLENKDIADIVILNEKQQTLYFLELKFYKKSHTRLGIGSGQGKGFQIEILKSNYAYFEKHLRWILATEEDDFFRFCTNEQIRYNISGDAVGEKYNSISLQIFKDERAFLTEKELVTKLGEWLLAE
ncbi:MAG: hypothetical protein J6I73_08435 [Treponema sp.]|nr:hypothetical protein [Treponema sp.]